MNIFALLLMPNNAFESVFVFFWIKQIFKQEFLRKNCGSCDNYIYVFNLKFKHNRIFFVIVSTIPKIMVLRKIVLRLTNGRKT